MRAKSLPFAVLCVLAASGCDQIGRPDAVVSASALVVGAPQEGASVGGKPAIETADSEKNPQLPRLVSAPATPSGGGYGEPSGLPLPSELTLEEFETQLFDFLKTRRYEQLGWRRDKTVRDTGPYIQGVYYGTHPAVRVYYSPGIMRWLEGGRVGVIPDGEMMIKEQYAPPAAQHRDQDDDALRDALESWTVMIKDARGSHDGWFWSNPGADAKVVDHHATNEQPTSGFGLYCVRCHASTQSPGAETPDALHNEFTFAALRNIEGFPGEPILFRVDDSWRTEKEDTSSEDHAEASDADEASAPADDPGAEAPSPDAEFLAMYPTVPSRKLDEISHLPPSSRDSVPAQRDKAHAFATSDQCMSCHAGLTGPFGPVGFVPTADPTTYGGPGVNVSPYGQWRWTPMGLAGRDPIFLAQLESEIAMIDDQFGADAKSQALKEATVDACLRCHGAMGHQQFHSEQGGTAKFSLESVLTAADSEPAHADADPSRRGDSEAIPSEAAHAASEGTPDHGALARDGISCMICHRMQPRPQAEGDTRPYLEHFLETSITGNLHLGPAGEIYGPYKNDEIASYAMHHATGWKPVHSDYIQKSQLCGTCHTVSLPTIDRPLDANPSEADRALAAGEIVPEFQGYRHHLEQATYLEWLNSQFSDEVDAENPNARSCQSCHMGSETTADEAGDLAGPIKTRIAAIQDDTYPDAENLAPHKSLHVRVRDEYRRHDFAGLNIGLIELFKQFNEVLGVKRTDYMTGSNRGAEQAIASMERTAREKTATVAVDARRVEKVDPDEPDLLEAIVRVTNLTGHRFPSGVGFRRAFLELQVIETRDDGEHVLWASGQTNSVGVIVDAQGQPLETEFFSDTSETQPHQPHHRLITSPDQVQVYETLLKDNRGRFTTSFVRGCETVKDNRLLPQGWSIDGPGGGLTGVYLEATHPGPDAIDDDDFTDGSGSDNTVYRIELPSGVDAERVTVRATLYYQATPPYYLKNLFTTAPEGDATQRLHAMASRLQLAGTPMEDWKLEIATASTELASQTPSTPSSEAQ